MSYQTLVQGDRIAFATQQGASLNQIAVITTDLPSRSTIYFGPSNIFRQDGTIDASQAVMAIDVFNKTVRVGSTYISSGGGIVEADLVSTTVALLAGAGGGSGLSILQLTSTVIGASATNAQLNNTLTSTVTGQFVSFSPALQAGLSTLGLFTSNTSNYYKNNLVNYSTTISSISTSVGATSNWSRGAFQDWSTPVSSVSTAAGQTSNWSRGTLQNWSTSVSTVALFTSNTSNWAANIQQNWSSAVSIATLYTSNTSNWSRNLLQDYSTPVSTVALYTSNTSNWAANIQQNWSSAVSTATLFTSNTSNWSRGTLQDYSTAVSTVALFTSNSSNYFMANAGGSGTSSLLGVISSGFSTIAFFTSNTSNYFLPALSNNYSTNLQSTVAGLGTAGYISTGQFLSSMIGINSNISSMIDPIELASSVVGLGTVGFVSAIGLTAILNSTVVGVNMYVSSMIDPVELTSSIIGLGAAGFISTVGLDNRLASTVFGVNSNMYSTTSGTSTQIANVYQYSRGLLQDYSTPVSTVSTTAGQTSNWSRNLLQDYSTPVSTVFFYSRNLLQDFSTPVSSVGLFTSNTSNYAKNILQDWSTPVNTLNLFTQNTSNYAKNILQDWSTPVSTIALYTSNTSNWASNIQQNWSSAVSVATLYTSNTSNWAKNAQQDWSTPVSTVALYASNTSNWASNIQQNWSSAVSIATLYTSNTSNWSKNMLQDYSTPISSVIFYTRNILQDWSTPVSSVSTAAGQTSNWSRNMLQDYSTPISSVIFYTKNILQDFSTPVSSISTTTGQTSNWSRNMLQDYSTPISSVIFYTKNILQDFSTPVSSVSTAAGQTSNWSRGAFQDWSTPVSSLSTYTGTASNWSRGILQDWSTPVNTVTLYTQNTSNWARGMLVDWSTPLSTATLYTSNTSNYYAPLLSNNYSTNLQSTVAGLGTATYISASQLYSTVTGVTFNGSTNTLSASRIFTSSIVAAFVTGTQGYISSLVVDSLAIGSNSGFINMGDIITTSHSTLQINTGVFTASGTVCTPQIVVSSINGQTLAQLATVPIQSTAIGLGTLGYISSTQLASTQAYLLAVTSTGLSSVALFTSNTSNYAKGILQDYSTPVSTVSTVAGQSSNWSRNLLQDYSTPVSTVALFTSNTSNYAKGILQDWSTATQSTVAGLGTASYISAAQLYSTVTGVIFNGSTNTLSSSRIFTSSLNASYVTATQGYISSLVIDSLQLGFNNAFFEMGDVIATSLSTLQVNTGTLAVSGTVCTPQIVVSTINGQTLSQLATVPIQSTAIGLGTLGYISTAAFLSSMLGITSNISSMIDPVELASSIVGLGTVGFVSSIGLTAIMNSTVQGVNFYVSSMIDPVELTSTITGLGASGFISTVGLDAKLASTVQGLGSATYISSAALQSTVAGLGSATYISATQLYSTVAGVGAMAGSTLGISTGTIRTRTVSSVEGYISSFRTDSLTVGGPTGYVNIQDLNAATISTGQLVAGAGFISSLQINTLSFGPSGYIIVSDVIANSLSTKKLNTQNLYANNVYVGNNSTQSMILFPGIDGAFKGTAVGEQTTGVGTEELLLYKVSTTSDQIRLQTTGNLVFEAGVSARSFPSTQMVATPTMYIQGSTSNVGIGTASPATTLDVAGTIRSQNVSSLRLTTSSILVSGSLNMTGNNASNVNSLTISRGITGSSDPFVAAGGTATTYYNSGTGVTWAVHAFNSAAGAFSFTPASNATNVQVLVVGGGGGGGGNYGAGGGAGGAVYATGLTMSAGIYTVTVGAGGAGGTAQGSVGGNSAITIGGTTYTGYGGGYGATYSTPYAGGNGGCGGGGSGNSVDDVGGIGSQGFNGGVGGGGSGGSGGGGMGTAGSNSTTVYNGYGGIGGTGAQYSITGTSLYYAGGGGGGCINNTYGSAGGLGGGGYWVAGTSTAVAGTNGLGGGGGGSIGGTGGVGGFGCVIIAYPLSQFGVVVTPSGTLTTDTFNNFTITPLLQNIRFLGPTEWRYITSSVSGATLDLTAATSYFATTYRLTGSATITITFPALTTGAWWTFINAYTGTQVLTFAGTTTGLTTPYSLLQSASITIYSDGTSYYLTTAGSPFTGSTIYISATTVQAQTLSTLNLNTSSINGQTLAQIAALPIQSTVVGLATAGYISSTQLASTQAYLLAVTSTGLSSVALFTSNTSNWAFNLLQDVSTPRQSTVAGLTQGLGSAGYISAAQLYSTVTGVIFNGSTNTLSSARIFTSSIAVAFVTGTQGYISSLVVDSLAIGSNSGFINMGDIITTSHSTLQINTGIFTASGTVCTPQIVVSSINGQTLAQLATVPIQSTVIGLATAGYISSSQLASTQAYLLAVTSTGLSSVALFTSNTSNWARGFIQDYSTPVSTVALFTSNTSNWSRNLLQDYSTPVSSVALFTSNTSNWSRGFIQDFSTPVSSVALFTSNTSNWARNLLQDYSTPVSSISTTTGQTSNWARNLLQDISTPISSLSTLYGTRLTSLSAAISTLTLQNFTSLQGSVSSLQVNSLLIGTGTGSINLGDTVMTAVSSVSTATNTLYALNTLLGNVSSQTAIQFYGLTGQFNGAVVAEKLVSPGVQELLLYKASSIQDQIRLQTTGNIVFEAGVASRSWSTSTAAATPTLYISYLSNVGIGTAAPATTLDVAGTGRFQNVSTLALTASSINGQTVAQLATLPIQSTVIGLGTAGYISSTQLASTQAYLLAVTSTGLSTVALFTSNTSNYARGFIQDFSTPVSSVSTVAGLTSNWSRNLLQDFSTGNSTVSLFTTNTSNYARNLLQDWSTPVSTVALFTSNTSNYARNILQDWSTARQSTVAGLGTATYISATQLYSTVAGITFSGSTNTLSASRIFTSSLNAAYVTSVQGYISSLVIDSLQLGFNNAFFEMGDVIATSLSTLQVNTGILTTSGVICTPQIIVSTINGTAPVNPTNITSTVAGLGTSGYVSSFVPVYVSLSTAALFTSNTSNWARNLLQDFSTPTTNTSNFFVPLLANNYSTNLTSTVVGLGTAGYISTGQFLSSMLGITSNISSMIDPVELASTVVALGTVGFVSSIGLTAILNSTVLGVNTYVSSMIDPVELASSITSLGTQGFISSIGFDAKLASTTAGLGTATYISATQLYSTVAGVTFNGSTNTLSSSRIFTSSIVAAFVTGTQGYISSLVVDSLAIGSNSGFINMGDIITTSHSSLQINTGIFTASGAVCTPQLIVSSVNGAVPLVAANITSSIIGLGTAGYLSSVGPLYGVVSSGLSTVATFTSNTSNFFLPALSNNYSTNLQSTFAGLATGGYISSSQLFSTVTALTGSTLSLSAGSVFASSIQTLRMSTAQAAVCTVTFQDQLAGNPLGNVYQYSSILYYNSFVIAGTTAMNIQNFTF